jgi:hypothetical protein
MANEFKNIEETDFIVIVSRLFLRNHKASILSWVDAFLITSNLNIYIGYDAARVIVLHIGIIIFFGSFHIFSSGLIISSRNRKGDCQLIDSVINFLNCRRLTLGTWNSKEEYTPYRMG